ncbi:MAG: succinylglutamate desuccinylase/aspartoacylase family protein [Planctomycetes bacterium]|nr:succinylglutamate desuccinylase/aspartoacylase family protein [Planctomycetota bacterium]
MSMQSLITTDVDLDKSGKQFGNLAVPQSTNSSGWAKRYIPIVVIKNGDGPTAVLFGGNHGDELEGPVALMNLARKLEPVQIQGRVIIVPMLNRPAVEAGTRLSPLDGCNMNRAFPGRPNDTITGMIAHYVSSTLLPIADLVVDVHSGGSSTHFLPSVNMHEVSDRQQMQKMIDAGLAWGAPYLFIYEDVAGAGLLPSLAEQMGKVTLGTEMGSKSQFGVEILDITARGIENVLAWANIMQPSGSAAPRPSEIVGATKAEDYIMAPASGIFEPLCELGDEVKQGTPVGQIHRIEHPEREPVAVEALTDGMIMARRAIPLTLQGEMVITIVRPYEISSHS